MACKKLHTDYGNIVYELLRMHHNEGKKKQRIERLIVLLALNTLFFIHYHLRQALSHLMHHSLLPLIAEVKVA